MPEVHVNYDNEQNWQRFFDLRRKVFKAITSQKNCGENNKRGD